MVERNGRLEFQIFNSVADITFGTEEGVSTESSTPYADEQTARESDRYTSILPDEDIAAIRGY